MLNMGHKVIFLSKREDKKKKKKRLFGMLFLLPKILGNTNESIMT